MSTSDATSGSPQGGFLSLFLAHQPQLFAFVLAHGVAPSDADDVLQDVAEVLWRRFEEFTLGSNFRAWSFAVTRMHLRKFADRRRRQQRCVMFDEQALDHWATEEAAPPEPPQIDRLRLCLERLTERSRTLIHNHYVDGMNQADAARSVGMSHDAGRTALSRVRRQLAHCIEQRSGAST